MSVVVLPPEPNEGSSVPSGLNRASAHTLAVPLEANPPTTMLPLPPTATAFAP